MHYATNWFTPRVEVISSIKTLSKIFEYNNSVIFIIFRWIAAGSFINSNLQSTPLFTIRYSTRLSGSWKHRSSIKKFSKRSENKSIFVIIYFYYKVLFYSCKYKNENRPRTPKSPELTPCHIMENSILLTNSIFSVLKNLVMQSKNFSKTDIRNIISSHPSLP